MSRRQGWMTIRVTSAAVALLFLTACSSPLGQTGAKQTNCADILAAQMVTSDIVPGAYQCMDEQGRQQFASPAELAAYSRQEPVIQSMRLLGRTDSGAYVYAARTSQGPAVFIIRLKDGKVAGMKGTAG